MNDSKIKVIAMQKLKWSVWNISPIGDFKMDGFVIKKCCFLYTKLNCHNDQWIKADYVVYFLQKWLKIKMFPLLDPQFKLAFLAVDE